MDEETTFEPRRQNFDQVMTSVRSCHWPETRVYTSCCSFRTVVSSDATQWTQRADLFWALTKGKSLEHGRRKRSFSIASATAGFLASASPNRWRLVWKACCSKCFKVAVWLLAPADGQPRFGHNTNLPENPTDSHGRGAPNREMRYSAGCTELRRVSLKIPFNMSRSRMVRARTVRESRYKIAPEVLPTELSTSLQNNINISRRDPTMKLLLYLTPLITLAAASQQHRCYTRCGTTSARDGCKTSSKTIVTPCSTTSTILATKTITPPASTSVATVSTTTTLTTTSSTETDTSTLTETDTGES